MALCLSCCRSQTGSQQNRPRRGPWRLAGSGHWPSLAPPIHSAVNPPSFTRGKKVRETRSAARLSPRISFPRAAISPCSHFSDQQEGHDAIISGSAVGTGWGSGPRRDGLASPSSASGIFRRVTIENPSPAGARDLRPSTSAMGSHSVGGANLLSQARSRLRKSKHIHHLATMKTCPFQPLVRYLPGPQ